MAIPTQATSGTEVLRRTGLSALTNNWTSIKFDGTMSTASTGSDHQAYTVPANHIIVVTSVIWCNQATANEHIHMWLYTADATSSDLYLLNNQPLPGYGTFTWADKFVLVGGDKLATVSANAANIDVWVNYIDQSWV